MEMRVKLRMLRTDRGGEFTSNEFTKYCKENGIARQLTAPYSPQQNGVVERRNRTVLSTTRRYTEPMEFKTPYEALYNRKPNLENLRIFGCTAYAKITTPHLKKLDDRSIPLVYLGVEEGSKACRLYDPIAKKKHVSRDVKFMETKPWDWNKDEEDTSTQDTFWASFVVEGVDNESATPRVEIGNLLLIEEEPRNYKEASIDKKWIEAMEIELDSINKNNTWTLTTLPPDQKAIGLKWEEVYVTQPEGFIQQGNSGKVYKLIKALYGLRQAPRAWNMKLDQTLKSLDFKKCNLEQAVYTRRSKTSTLIVGVYVDDLIITGTPRKEIDAFKSQMKDRFEMSDLGLLAYYLGIEVTQTGGEITIKQTGYINKILKETSMTDSNDRDYNGSDTSWDQILVIQLELLSRFMQRPKDNHLRRLKQVIRYIKGTKEHGIIYKKEGGCKITGYSDSSYGINTDQGKGTTGIVFYFGESPITWCTQKQPTVALSSCESEFMAATGAACQALILKFA
ncbi:zinc finger, CCHC-type containing protein [Tanacetum coccineum]